MKLFTIFIYLLFTSCSPFPGTRVVEIDNTHSTQSINSETEVLLKKLFKLWEEKNSNLIEMELGVADNKITNDPLITYSYQAHFETFYEQLVFVTTNDSFISSIKYEFLDEKNEQLNDKWLSNILQNSKWKLVEITNKAHTVVPKKVLINYEKNIIAGYIEGYKNNQLRFIYFGPIDEKKLDQFKWD